MKTQIDDLVRMRDIETLVELMEENDDWMMQLDAAEGLARLGDRRGLEFLLSAADSDSREVRQIVKEILDDPAMARLRAEMEADEKREREERIKTARARMQKGRKVFRYKMVYLPSGEFMNDVPEGGEYDLPALDDEGMLGWEVVHVLPYRGRALAEEADHIRGAYFLMRREITAEDAAELDSL